MTRTITFSVSLAWLLWATALVQAAEDYSWRASVTSERARAIAGELFPDKCGPFGEKCGITYDDRRACPFEFVVVFDGVPKGRDEPRLAFVTLDKNGGVVGVTSKPKKSCRSATS